MKICSPQLGLYPKSYLGGEVHDHFIIQGLASKGHKIFVYLPKSRLYQKHKNIVVDRAPIKHIPAIIFNLMIIPYLIRIYSREKFDVLRVHNPYFVGLGALFFKFLHPKVKVAVTYHLVENALIFDLINKLTITKYDLIFTVSQYIKDWIVKKYNIPKEKIQVIYNGVDDSIKPLPKSKSLLNKYSLEGKFVILFMGLLIDRKNPIFLVEVFKKIKQKYKNTALIFCGVGPLKKTLENYVKSNSLEDVIFTGAVFADSKVEHFNICDLFVMPSLNEGYGIVIAEAMTCAKPVVITNGWSANEAITNGVEGFLAAENNKKDWQSKIETLITNDELRALMGKNAKKRAEQNFSWQKSIEKVENNLLKSVNRT